MSDKEAATLTLWACCVLAALLVAIFGTLALAALKGAGTSKTCVEARPCGGCETGGEAKGCDRAADCEADQEGVNPPPPPPPPPSPLPPLIIDLNVNTVSAPTAESGSTGPRSGGGATTQTVTVNGVPVAPASGDGQDGGEEAARQRAGSHGADSPAAGSGCAGDDCNGATTQSVVLNVPPPATTVGVGGRDLVVLLDREKTVEKTVEKASEPACRLETSRCGGEKPDSLCTDRSESGDGSKRCKKARKLGQVKFDHGTRRFVPSQPDPIARILNRLDERTGPLLVVGHGDRCGQRRLAERRAKKVRGELRRLLKKRLAWEDGRIRVHAQAAGVGSGALEERCAAGLYRTAGVYLIEGLT